MRRLLLTLALTAAAHASALGLEDAWRSAPARPEAITTRLELLTARSNLVRVEADPLALRLDKLQATQEVERLEAEHRHALLSAMQEIAEAYTGVLQARDQAGLAREALALTESALEVARIRFANGSATALELREAEIAVDEARQNVEAAENGLGVARANLEGMIGVEVDPAELEPVSDELLATPPALEALLAGLSGHPTLLQASQGVELARAAVELLDPAYAPAAQIESARTQLATAEELVAEARRGFELQARNAYLQVGTAADKHDVAAQRAAAAEERLGLEELRLQGGLISRLQRDQAALEARRRALELQAAKHDHLLALLRLQTATMYDLGLAPAGAVGQ
jgi:outer membrane protein TolC